MTILTDINKQYLSRAVLADVVNSMRCRVSQTNPGLTAYNFTSATWVDLNFTPATTLNFTASSDDLVICATNISTSHSISANFTQFRHELNGVASSNLNSMAYTAASTGAADEHGFLMNVFTSPINGSNTLKVQGQNPFGTGTAYYANLYTYVILLRRQ